MTTDHPDATLQRLRILVVLDKDPLPATSGSKQRATNLISAAAELGDVDLVLADVEVDGARCEDIRASLDVADVAATGVLSHPGRPTPEQLALPSRLTSTDLSRAHDWYVGSGRPTYHLALFIGLPGWWMLRDVVRASVPVVDTENVMSSWAARMARTEVASAGPGVPLRRRARALQRAGRHLLDAPRWARVERQASAAPHVLVACSPTDLHLLGAPRAAVVANGVARPSAPVGRTEVGTPPTFVFPGKMSYGPNLDACRFLVDEVVPELLAAVPEARVVLAGTAPRSLHDLASEHVEVTGYVDRMEDVLARADAVVVPLRAGGGTRIKILEAWAHRLPVVSTTVGAEGLGAVDGIDLLLADTPRDFADACRRIVSDRTLRLSLVERGSARIDQEYDWSIVRRRATDLFTHLLGAGDRGLVPAGVAGPTLDG